MHESDKLVPIVFSRAKEEKKKTRAICTCDVGVNIFSRLSWTEQAVQFWSISVYQMPVFSECGEKENQNV